MGMRSIGTGTLRCHDERLVLSVVSLQRAHTPEEGELRLKLAELKQLEQELAEAELSLVTLRTDLNLFERRYLRIVGVRLAELDEIEAAILQMRSRDSTDEELLARAREAAARAHQSRTASSGEAKLPPPVEPTPRSDELRQLYREVAKRLHPDLAPDAGAKVARTDFMSRANRAYAEGDATALRKLLEEWSSRPEDIVGESVGAQLIRAIRRIAQAKRRLTDIGSEMASLAASPLSTLSRDAATAAAAGRDLLVEMADRLDAEVVAARLRLRRTAQAS